MELNKIYNCDCLEGMKKIDDGSIDLVVTSPPYDNLRTYNQGIDKTWGENVWKPIIQDLYRVLKEGGVVVWIVSDATIKGSETGTSFKQALYFMECGFNLHDTMIWCKDGGGAIGSNLCYTQNFEYMFVFSKGKPKSVNLIYDKKCKTYTGKTLTVKETRGGGERGDRGDIQYKRKEMSRRNNWWYLVPKKTQGSKFHPAVFPENLVIDHIKSWSNENDIVLDPFMGSGTTALAALNTNRKFIGFEISKDYFDKSCEIIDKKRKEIENSLFNC